MTLNHICWLRGEADSYEVIELLADVAVDCLLASPESTISPISSSVGVRLGSGNSTASADRQPSFKPFLQVCSTLILTKAATMPSSLTFDAAILKLLQTSNQICTRRYSGAAEFVYAVMKLLFRLGTLDAENNIRVHRLRGMYCLRIF